MLGGELRSGTFETKESQAGLVRVSLFYNACLIDQLLM